MPRKLNLKKQFAQLMDLPPEAVINSALIKIVGNLEISISNHRGLVEYTTTAIRVASPGCDCRERGRSCDSLPFQR